MAGPNQRQCEDDDDHADHGTSSRLGKIRNIIADFTDMEVTIPKRVRLHNSRLNKLHKILQAGILVVSIFRLVFLRQWTSLVRDGHISVTMHGEASTLRDMNSNALAQRTNEAAQTQLCDRSVAPYEVSVGGAQTSASCLPICSASTRAVTTQNITCVNPFELAALHSTPRETLFVTGIVDTGISDSDAITRKFYLTPYDEGMELTFDYTVTLPASYSGVHGLSQDFADGTSQGERLQLTSAQHMSTRLIAQDGSSAALFQPGEAIKLTLSEVLAFSGKPHFLRTGAGGMPTGHLLGLQVELRVQCKLNTQDAKGGTCDARFFAVIRAAPDRSRFLSDRGVRAYYGVHVQAQGECSYEVLDLNELWAAGISFLVIWGIPRQIIGVLARFLLGHTSKIYNRVIVENFHIRETVVGFILRLMMGRECFAGIAGEDGVIDPNELVHALTAIFANQVEDFDKHAVAAMATHCWRSIITHQKNRNRITPQSFNAALIAQETVRLDDILTIFRGDRKKKFLERFFLPEGMKRVEDMLFTRSFESSRTYDVMSIAADVGNAGEAGEVVEIHPEDGHDLGAQAGSLELKRANAAERPDAGDLELNGANAGERSDTPHGPNSVRGGDSAFLGLGSQEIQRIRHLVPRARELAMLLKKVNHLHEPRPAAVTPGGAAEVPLAAISSERSQSGPAAADWGAQREEPATGRRRDQSDGSADRPDGSKDAADGV